MRSRRIFISSIIKSALVSFVMPTFAINEYRKMKIQPGIQLYTVRNELKNDFWGTLKLISEIGFKEIELYIDDSLGLFYGFQPEYFFTRVHDLGLKVIGQHVLSGKVGNENIYSLTNGFESMVELLSKYKVPYLTHVWLHPGERKNMDDYRTIAELQNKCGEFCKNANVQLTYHNHDFEFIKMEGAFPYDVLINNTSSEFVKLEVDFYWMYAAGIDPLKYIKQYQDRVEQWHFKDMKEDRVGFTELGTGRIDFDAIMEYVEKSAVKHVFLDQDELTMSIRESLNINFQTLSMLLNK